MRIGSLKIHLLPRAINGWRFSGPAVSIPAMNLLVEVCDHRGISRGWGEGVLWLDIGAAPLSDTRERLSNLIGRSSFPWHMTTSAHIRRYITDLPETRNDNPLVCAIEMALLDTLGHAQHKPLTAYFPIRHGAGTVCYGVTVAVADDCHLPEVCRHLRATGTQHLRVQMNHDTMGNIRRMAVIESAIDQKCDVCIDPAGSWTGDLSMAHLPMIRHAPVHVVQEPMPLSEKCFGPFAAALATMGVRLMACRAGATMVDVQRLIATTPYRLVDIDLSRNGGFHRALKIVGMLRESCVDYQISSDHEGTGLLAAAGRSLNLLCGDAKYRNGARCAGRSAYHLATAKTAYDPRGEAGPFRGAGLGVKMDRRRLEHLRKGPAIIFRAPN